MIFKVVVGASGAGILIKPASTANLAELTRLYCAYRVFYGEEPEEDRAAEFLHERVMQSTARYFLAWSDAAYSSSAIGFVHLMPSTNTLAMRPIWLLEDLYVDLSARGLGTGTALLTFAESFARSSGAERLTLSTAHDNLAAQTMYKKLGYVQDQEFFYFHRLLR